jgi:hypothetical protein
LLQYDATSGEITYGPSNIAGTLTTAAQPNITSVGTLGSLSVTGATSAGTLSLQSISNTSTSNLLYYNTTTKQVSYGSVATPSMLPITLDTGNNRVGINNASPTQTLDVVGNVISSGSITAGSSLTASFGIYGNSITASTLEVGTIADTAKPIIIAGTGSPEGSVGGNPGSLFLRKNGSVYLKTSGGSTSSGWTSLSVSPSPTISTTSVSAQTLSSGVYTSYCTQTLQPGYYTASALISTPAPNGTLHSFQIIVQGIGAIASIQYGSFVDQSISGVVQITSTTTAFIEAWANATITNMALSLKFLKVG